MRRDPNVVRKHSGKIVLSNAKSVGNGTITISAAPFPLKDTIYYQIDKHGDYTQEGQQGE